MLRPLVALLVALVTSIVMSSSAAAPATTPAQLTITAHTGSTSLVPSQATLDCDGGAHATGFLQHVAPQACTFVRRGGVTLIQAAHHRDRLCGETYGGPQRARITGKIGRRRIAVTIGRVDSCGIAEWDLLRPVLGDPGRSETIPRRRTSTTSTTGAPPASYRVRRGDTLTGIARQFHTSVQAIMTTNQLADPDHLTEGQQLVMPPPGTVRLDAALAGTGSSQVVRFTMTGVDPGELVTFVVTLPTGETFTGTPHAASATGEVSADYTAELLHGTYHVTGTGERGTTAETAFHLVRSD